MAENKTVATDKDVTTFLNGIEHKGRREAAEILLDMMARVTGKPATMWGPTMIGFDSYHYVYDSGREGDSFIAGFSPRKANMVVYITPGFDDYGELLEQLGPYKSSVSCLYLGRLTKIDLSVLEELVSRSYKDMKSKYAA